MMNAVLFGGTLSIFRYLDSLVPTVANQPNVDERWSFLILAD